MKILSGKEIVNWTRGECISKMSVDPYDENWVSVKDLLLFLYKRCDADFEAKALEKEVSKHNSPASNICGVASDLRYKLYRLMRELESSDNIKNHKKEK